MQSCISSNLYYDQATPAIKKGKFRKKKKIKKIILNERRKSSLNILAL